MSRIEQIGDATLYLGDCLVVMQTMEPDSIDSIVTDPPYGLSFMGKEWDHGVPGREFWEQALRVAKPGAHLLAFGGTRTFHRLTVAIEDSGWEIRDCLQWIYGSGFPKSLDVGKAIDKAAGAERDVVGERFTGAAMSAKRSSIDSGTCGTKFGSGTNTIPITAPATDAAKQWDGWGTALKPSWEPIILARKPLSGTVAENVQRYGTGALNIGACRVPCEPGDKPDFPAGDYETNTVVGAIRPTLRKADGVPSGRWPANTIHDGSKDVLDNFPNAGGWHGISNKAKSIGRYGNFSGATKGSVVGFGDSGSAARFFYCAKASKQDRDEGCEGLPETYNRGSGTHGNGTGTTRLGNAAEREAGITHVELSRVRNHHPTVKPTPLMRYLVRLVTPPGGLVLDPFMGSGSTGKAAVLDGFRFAGIELDNEYLDISCARIADAYKQYHLSQAEAPRLFQNKE